MRTPRALARLPSLPIRTRAEHKQGGPMDGDGLPPGVGPKIDSRVSRKSPQKMRCRISEMVASDGLASFLFA